MRQCQEYKVRSESSWAGAKRLKVSSWQESLGLVKSQSADEEVLRR